MTSVSKRRGFSVRVFLPDGDPDGIKVVEKSNWTGRGLVIPRPIFPEARSREELKSTGVYILVGPSESAALPKTYIGEGDPVLPRLDQHFKHKDFWTHAIAFTSKDAKANEKSRMITSNAKEKIGEFNSIGLHYNLVADAVYKKRTDLDSPFNPEYLPYIVAALISFEMERMMGPNRASRYDIKAGGFATLLSQKLAKIQPLITAVQDNFSMNARVL
jgi:hypothetical protein